MHCATMIALMNHQSLTETVNNRKNLWNTTYANTTAPAAVDQQHIAMALIINNNMLIKVCGAKNIKLLLLCSKNIMVLDKEMR